jgi:hypothetical protein
MFTVQEFRKTIEIGERLIRPFEIHRLRQL